MKGYENALFQNRRQIRASDITQSIQSVGALDWLREDFPDVKPALQASASAARAKEKAAVAAAKERPSALDFFKPQQTVSERDGRSAPALDDE